MKTPEQMTREELLAEVRRLREGSEEHALRRAILELEVYREEVRQQNEELVGAQKQLEWSRDRYADLFDSAPVGYLTLDAHCVVEEINLTGARLLGRPVQAIVGRPFLFAVAEADELLRHVRRCRESEGLVVSEMSLRGPGGAPVPVEVRSRAVRSEGRVLLRTTLTDLTERRRAEAERRAVELEASVAREANEAKDRLLAILGHELRNPLSVIATSANVLAQASLPEPFAETVERIRRAVAAEARLISDLLDASRLRYGKLRIERHQVELHTVLADVLAGLQTDPRSQPIRLELRAAEHTVSGDPMRLGQIVSNLVRNAQNATAHGGEIRVVTSNPAPGRILVSVIDTGCGIESEELGRIFSPFEQSKKRDDEAAGLGLGLSICKALVEAHRGRIEARSDGPGRGARFDVELPVLRGPSELRQPA